MTNEKLVFEGRLLKVYVEQKTLPNGYKASIEKIKHVGAALIAPFLSKDKVIMIRQYRPAIDQYIYELPAGTLNKGENINVCAGRELIEESGYKAGKIKKIGAIYPAPGYTNEKIVIFKAENLKKVEVKKEADEVISVMIMSKSQIKKLFKSGKLLDAKTICAFAMCGWL